MSLLVRTRVVRLGAERCSEAEIFCIRLFARRRVRSRLSSGRLPSVMIELSVKSMASCWSYEDVSPTIPRKIEFEHVLW